MKQFFLKSIDSDEESPPSEQFVQTILTHYQKAFYSSSDYHDEYRRSWLWNDFFKPDILEESFLRDYEKFSNYIIDAVNRSVIENSIPRKVLSEAKIGSTYNCTQWILPGNENTDSTYYDNLTNEALKYKSAWHMGASRDPNYICFSSYCQLLVDNLEDINHKLFEHIVAKHTKHLVHEEERAYICGLEQIAKSIPCQKNKTVSKHMYDLSNYAAYEFASWGTRFIMHPEVYQRLFNEICDKVDFFQYAEHKISDIFVTKECHPENLYCVPMFGGEYIPIRSDNSKMSYNMFDNMLPPFKQLLNLSCSSAMAIGFYPGESLKSWIVK